MSVEEESELRDMLTQTLEGNGSLAKIRAQLRACVFLALDEDELVQKKQPLLNTGINHHLETAQGKLMFCIVREFLEFFNLDYTISVYEPESYAGSGYFYEGRNKIAENLQLDSNDTVPLLLQLIKIAQNCNLQDTRNKQNETPAIKINGVLDKTFDVSPTTVESEQPTPRSVESNDTFEGTSSIAEDSEKVVNNLSVKSNAQTESPRSLLDSTINDFSSPVLKETKSSSEKLKQKTPKNKTTLTSLADLPPLQLNKSRNDSMLLPSLYSNDFKEKNREMDKFFENDLLDNYEEDFMSGSEIDLKSDRQLKLSPAPDLNDSVASSVTSDDFEINSNVDDILVSNSSN